MKTIICISDCHIENGEEEHSSYTLVKKFIKEIKPDVLIINGDFLDFSYLSSFNESLEILREGKRLKKDFDLLDKELNILQKSCKKIVYLEGNHEYRLTRFTEKLPNLLDGLVSIPALLSIHEKHIEWRTLLEQPYKIGHLHFCHGFRTNIHATKSTLEDYGCNMVMGHIHRASSTIKTFYNRDPIGCWSTGCLCSKNPEWLNGRQNQWNNGFLLAYINDDETFNAYPINMINSTFVWEGKMYKL